MSNWLVNSKKSLPSTTRFVFRFSLTSVLTIHDQKRAASGNKGYYHHPIIEQAVNDVWFSNKKDDGVKYPDIYKPFPKVALALILTAVCFLYLQHC
jgi:hypothetical protein